MTTEIGLFQAKRNWY